jgi:hypothetical protein
MGQNIEKTDLQQWSCWLTFALLAALLASFWALLILQYLQWLGQVTNHPNRRFQKD